MSIAAALFDSCIFKGTERLMERGIGVYEHIFEKQVYGLAPPEVIYRIAPSYILGFDEDGKIVRHNFRRLDALPYAKAGTLVDKLDEVFP